MFGAVSAGDVMMSKEIARSLDGLSQVGAMLPLAAGR